jgi:hypothetical protein
MVAESVKGKMEGEGLKWGWEPNCHISSGEYALPPPKITRQIQPHQRRRLHKCDTTGEFNWTDNWNVAYLICKAEAWMVIPQVISLVLWQAVSVVPFTLIS